MILWMLYTLAISMLLAGAACAAEFALRLYDRPARGVWAAALIGSVLVPLALLFPSRRATMSAPATPSGDDLATIGDPLVIGGGPLVATPALDLPILAACATAAALMIAVLVVSLARLAHSRGAWYPAVVDGERVLISRSTGPAVVGVIRSVIVLPAWVMTLDASVRALLLEHEREHLRAGDVRLLCGTLAVLALMPWNPVLWWQFHRLRLAMEVDCDSRVLRRHPDVRAYGRALLEVGQRASRAALPMTAFSERRSLLERRVRTMITPRLPRPLRRAALLTGVALGALLGACMLPQPGRPHLAVSRAPLSGEPVIQPSLPSLPAAAAPTGPAAAPVVPPEPRRAVAAADTPIDLQERPVFTPRTQEPELPTEQRTALLRYLERNYPPALRDAGTGARAVLWVFIDEQGRVRNTQVVESSGYPSFDQLVQEAIRAVEWVPARNRDVPVPVWIQLPVAFQTRGDAGAARVPPPTPADSPADSPAAPPEAREQRFVPEEAPRLLNREALLGAVERRVAALGRSGRVVLWVFVDESGEVQRTRLMQGSGDAQLDEAAQEVVHTARFAPARDRGEPVPVWIQLPIVFQARAPSV